MEVSGAKPFQATLAWAVACQLLDSGLQLALRPRVWKRLKVLTQDDLTRLRNVLVAFVHSCVMFQGAVPYLLPLFAPATPPFLIITQVQPNTGVEQFYAEIMLGYLLYDLVAALRVGDGFLMISHHLLGMASHSSMCYYNVGGVYMMWVHFAEGSTPFLHLSWMMKKLKVEGRVLTVTQLLFAFLFFVTRVVSSPVCLYSLWTRRELWAPHDALHKAVTVITVFFVSLNYIWWAKIWAKLWEALLGVGLVHKKRGA